MDGGVDGKNRRYLYSENRTGAIILNPTPREPDKAGIRHRRQGRIEAGRPMFWAVSAGKIAPMAAKFLMDPQTTRAGLSGADAAAASQLGAGAGTARVGGYATRLLAAITGTRMVHQAGAETRVVANSTSRESSVAAVQTAEAANSGTLST